MSRLKLTFSSISDPELLRIDFQSKEGELFVSLRGKALSDSASFQWSIAAHALAIFFTSAIERIKGDPTLQGESGSAAASLDFALSKQPEWLLNAFGHDSEGNSNLRSIVRRSNSNLKRPGPVVLRLNELELPSSEISIFIGNLQLQTRDECINLIQSLNKSFETRVKRSTRRLESDGLTIKENAWECIVREELWKMLRGTNIFCRKNLSSKLREISSNPSFTRIAGNGIRLVSDIDLKSS